jgi:hypothetical protein
MRSLEIKENKIKNQYDIIKILADDKNITIAKLCKDIGITRQWLWDGGTRNRIKGIKLQKINNYFCIDINFFTQFYNDNIQRIYQNIGDSLID